MTAHSTHPTRRIEIYAPRRARLPIALVVLTIFGISQVGIGHAAPTNLLSASQNSFERSAGGWVAQGNTTISRTTATAAVGIAALQVKVDSLGPWPDSSRTARVGTSPGAEGIPVQPGVVYDGSVKVKAQSRLSPVRCELRWYQSDGLIIDNSFGALSTEVAGQWSQRTCRGKAPAGAAFGGLRVFISNANYGDIHYVDDAWITTAASTTSTTAAPATTTTVPPATTTTQPPTTTTTKPPVTTTTLPPPPAAGTYPARGSVGFRGNPSTLKVLDGTTPVPAGTSWNSQYNYLQVDAASLVLDGYYVKGGIDYYGGGTLTIRNSIIEGGWGTWFVVMGRTGGATMDVRDTTLRWRVGTTPDVGSGNGALQIAATMKIISIRNDISGTADGIQLAGDDSRVEQTWIHDLAAVGQYPNNTHNDGIQIYDGQRIVILNNRIEIGFDGMHQNAAVFFQPGDGNSVPAPQIVGNYLQGGGFTLRLEGPTTNTITNNNVFGSLDGGWGYSYCVNGASISQWNNNRDMSGASVGMP